MLSRGLAYCHQRFREHVVDELQLAEGGLGRSVRSPVQSGSSDENMNYEQWREDSGKGVEGLPVAIFRNWGVTEMKE